jgi:cardiolipin synthase
MFGAYLDPIADKILMATAFIVLAYVKIVPLWLTLLVISRDLFIVVGSTLYLMLIDSTDIRPTAVSKLNTVVQILTVVYFLAYAAFPEVSRFLPVGESSAIPPLVIGLCALTTAVSGAQYLYMGIRTLSDEP